MEIKSFSDFGLSTPGLVGDKIGMDLVLNKEIIVIDYRVEKSKYPDRGNPECVYMQIEFEGNKRVLFSGSKVLTDTIKQIPKGTKFKTTIIKPRKHLQFT